MSNQKLIQQIIVAESQGDFKTAKALRQRLKRIQAQETKKR